MALSLEELGKAELRRREKLARVHLGKPQPQWVRDKISAGRRAYEQRKRAVAAREAAEPVGAE
jgi:hypothetical protein